MRKATLGLLAVALVSLLFAGSFMALSSKLCLFSAVSGVVLRGGEPVVGAEVEREYLWGWKDRTRAERTHTDAEGRFTFAAATEKSMLASLMPHEPLVTQKIFIRDGGNEYKAWMFTKHNYRENGELEGRPIQLTCDLDSEPLQRGDVFGIGAQD